MKLAALVAVPSPVTTVRPVSAPVGTVAVMLVEELTVTDVDSTPPNLTLAVLAKPLPLIVTAVPTGPLVGPCDGEERPQQRDDGTANTTRLRHGSPWSPSASA